MKAATIIEGKDGGKIMKALRLVGIGLCALFTALVMVNYGCEYIPESTFQLAKESRLPRWITLPPGLRRDDVTATMNYYTPLWGSDVNFVLRDKTGVVLAKTWGRTKGTGPLYVEGSPSEAMGRYPSYAVVTVNGITEIIEHRKMEPIFYVTDDLAVWRELTGARPPTHP